MSDPLDLSPNPDAAPAGLTLEAASRIVDAALAHARAERLEPLCVVVLDAGASPLALKREEGAGWLRPGIAQAKAAGALGLGMGSRAIARRAAERPAFFSAVAEVSGGRLAPSPGGVLIRDADGRILGAVGVSGDAPDADEACALKGVAAQPGLTADPGA